MNSIIAFETAVFALFSLLLFLVPIYINHIEKTWLVRLYGTNREASLSRTLSALHRGIRRSIMRLVIAEESILCAIAILVPKTIVHGIAILLLGALALYHRHENARKCPSCYSLIADTQNRCPDCGASVGNRWGVATRAIESKWLTKDSRYFRYKCS